MMKKVKSIPTSYFIFAALIVGLVSYFSSHHQFGSRWPASGGKIDCAKGITSFLRNPYFTKRYFASGAGDFADADSKVAIEVMDEFKAQKAGGSFHQKLNSDDVRRVKANDFENNLATMGQRAIRRVRQAGLKKIKDLSIVTSAAGLWSRGGGAVKALIPYNIKKLLGRSFDEVSFGGKIFAAKTNVDVLLISRLKRVTSGVEDSISGIFASKVKSLIKNGDKSSTDAFIEALQSLKKTELDDLAQSIEKEVDDFISKGLDDLSKKLSASGLMAEVQESLVEQQKLLQSAKLDQAKIFEVVNWLRDMDAGGADRIARRIVDEQKRQVTELIESVQYNTSALNAVDLKMMNVATLSQKSNSYVPLDFWTSEQTHGKVDNYIKWLKQNFQSKVFSEDVEQDKAIKAALSDYFAKSERLGETHIFGYQRGLHALDVETGEYLENTPKIGKGAGDITRYLIESGRRDELVALGKKDFVFENIEVVSDYAPIYQMYRQSGKDVGVVLVPQKAGYKGGSPFWVKNDQGEWEFKLLEMSALDEQFAKGNDYFNSNTIFVSLDVKGIDNIAFELKNQNTIARVKLNMGDVTLDNDAAGILGRCGQDEAFVEYENYKSMDDYGRNGLWHLKVYLDNLKEYDVVE